MRLTSSERCRAVCLYRHAHGSLRQVHCSADTMPEQLRWESRWIGELRFLFTAMYHIPEMAWFDPYGESAEVAFEDGPLALQTITEAQEVVIASSMRPKYLRLVITDDENVGR